MSEPFLAEIRMVGFNFPPRGWAFCDGQILPINQNQSLYSLLGSTYGGDGRTSFALPDIRGRVPIHTGQSGGGVSYIQGQKVGEETVTLTTTEIASHNHKVNSTSSVADQAAPSSIVLPAANTGKPYRSNGSGHMAVTSIANAGGGQTHNNIQPSLALNFCIALQGLFPSRN